MNLDEFWIDYAIRIGTTIKKNPEKLDRDMKTESIPGCLVESYKVLVKQQTLPPIETIPKEEKSRIWERSKSLSDNPEKRIMISKSIYLIETITKDQ